MELAKLMVLTPCQETYRREKKIMAMLYMLERLIAGLGMYKVEYSPGILRRLIELIENDTEDYVKLHWSIHYSSLIRKKGNRYGEVSPSTYFAILSESKEDAYFFLPQSQSVILLNLICQKAKKNHIYLDSVTIEKIYTFLKKRDFVNGVRIVDEMPRNGKFFYRSFGDFEIIWGKNTSLNDIYPYILYMGKRIRFMQNTLRTLMQGFSEQEFEHVLEKITEEDYDVSTFVWRDPIAYNKFITGRKDCQVGTQLRDLCQGPVDVIRSKELRMDIVEIDVEKSSALLVGNTIYLYQP